MSPLTLCLWVVCRRQREMGAIALLHIFNLQVYVLVPLICIPKLLVEFLLLMCIAITRSSQQQANIRYRLWTRQLHKKRPIGFPFFFFSFSFWGKSIRNRWNNHVLLSQVLMVIRYCFRWHCKLYCCHDEALDQLPCLSFVNPMP